MAAVRTADEIQSSARIEDQFTTSRAGSRFVWISPPRGPVRLRLGFATALYGSAHMSDGAAGERRGGDRLEVHRLDEQPLTVAEHDWVREQP
jgi:hypothetical protein